MWFGPGLPTIGSAPTGGNQAIGITSGQDPIRMGTRAEPSLRSARHFLDHPRAPVQVVLPDATPANAPREGCLLRSFATCQFRKNDSLRLLFKCWRRPCPPWPGRRPSSASWLLFRDRHVPVKITARLVDGYTGDLTDGIDDTCGEQIQGRVRGDECVEVDHIAVLPQERSR